MTNRELFGAKNRTRIESPDTNQERVLKLAEACLRVASDVERGKLPLKALRRSHVFFDNGGCGCAFGHAISRAGLRDRMEPYYIRGSAGGKSSRWVDNHLAYEAATGCPATHKVKDQLAEVELANDVHSGDERKRLVVTEMTKLSRLLNTEAVSQ